MLLGVTLAACFYCTTMINHDTGWLLIATQRWLNGAELYNDIMEINPPLIFFLTAPVDWLAVSSGISTPIVFFLMTSCVGAISLAWTWRLLALSVTRNRRALMSAAAFIGVFVTPMPAFGQREHLMVIFALPYVVLTAFKPGLSNGERYLIGIFAFAGLALKPYFLLIPLFISISEFVRKRRLTGIVTIERLIIGGGCIFYLIVIAVVFPRYLEVIIPLGKEVYGAYRGAPQQVLAVPGIVAFAALIWLFSQAKPSTVCDGDRAITLVTVVGAVVCAYLLQFKGWYYHRLPIYSFMCMATSWIVTTCQQSAPQKRVIHAILCILAISFTIFPVLRGPYYNPSVPAFAAYLPADAQARSFVTLSAHVWASFPLANLYGARVTSRYPALWLIPGAVQQLDHCDHLNTPDCATLNRILEFAKTSTVEDFLAGKPTTVFVDARTDKPYFHHVAFNYLDFFKQDARFESAWQNYKHIDSTAGFEIWRRLPD